MNLWAQSHDYELWTEPVERLLFVEDFFADMRRWAFHHQLDFLLVKGLEARRIAAAARPVCQDRWLVECFEIFARKFHEDGLMSEREFALLQRACEALNAGCRAPHLLVYVHTSVPELHARVRARGRPHEADVTVEWITDLCERYERWLSTLRIPVLRIDSGICDWRHDGPCRAEILHLIEEEVRRATDPTAR
jgi:deoxyadenosine/deoxycytidine kinase